MSDQTESFELDPGQTVVLNGLIDLYAEETIVLDGDSATHLRTVVDEVTAPEERSSFREELDRLTTLVEGESTDVPPGLTRFVKRVTDGLAERGYSISVSHEYQQAIAPVDAHVYSFLNTRDRQRLRPLDLSASVETAIAEGTDLLETEANDEARSTFSEAVDRSTGDTENLVSRIVAGWGYFRTGDDETAQEYVNDVLSLEADSWAARVVGAAVSRDENDFVRSGKKSVGIILRWVTTGSENTSTRAEIGAPSDDDGIAWTEVDHMGGHAFLDQLYPETWLRFELRGRLPEFPSLHVYFLGFGVYDNEMDYIEKVIERFGTGPHNTGSVERISIDR